MIYNNYAVVTALVSVVCIFLIDIATMATISTIATPSIDPIINISQSADIEIRTKVIFKSKSTLHMYMHVATVLGTSEMHACPCRHINSLTTTPNYWRCFRGH